MGANLVMLASSLSAQTVFTNGIDPASLGKGDWIWLMPATETRLGYTNTQQVIDYEVRMGMQWLTVKCGDSTNFFSQFDSNLVNQANAAGLKIFAYAYAYGLNSNNVVLETKVATTALQLGADGFIIDAESEYEASTNNQALAAQYCQGIRAAYPHAFLAHNPFYDISLHTNFPYATFGYFVDAVMPQAFWIRYSVTPPQMLARVNNEFGAWQNALTGTNRNAIKPIIPVAQSYSTSTNQIDTGAQITAFVNALKADTNNVSAGGYNGVSFYECQDRNADMDTAVGAATIGGPLTPQFKQLKVFPAGSLQILLNGRIGSTYEIDRSTNLTSWTAVTNFVNSNGNFNFVDPNAVTNRTGYYRAKRLTN